MFPTLLVEDLYQIEYLFCNFQLSSQGLQSTG